MSEDAGIFDYLARGGKLTSPENAPPRYRAELMRMMASFVDSEFAGAAGFADLINDGPGIRERIAASRIVMEKFDHGERVLAIMGEFGANIDRYQSVHPWNERIGRNENLGATRRGGDMRLNVFHYPLQGWLDAVVMNSLMGLATVVQLRELARASYQPLADVFEEILPRETRHAELGEEGVARLLEQDASAPRAVRESIDYWRPRVAASFGAAGSPRFDMLSRCGLRHRRNEELLVEWEGWVDRFVSARLGSYD
jgi:1,2-phenylacetyl-CoA epoxidase catalytic subunit